MLLGILKIQQTTNEHKPFNFYEFFSQSKQKKCF